MRKFVINDGDLILGDVDFHHQLGADTALTTGGGEWHYDVETKTIYFYGESLKFGRVTKEQFNAASKTPSVERCNLVFNWNI